MYKRKFATIALVASLTPIEGYNFFSGSNSSESVQSNRNDLETKVKEFRSFDHLAKKTLEEGEVILIENGKPLQYHLDIASFSYDVLDRNYNGVFDEGDTLYIYSNNGSGKEIEVLHEGNGNYSPKIQNNPKEKGIYI